MNTKKKELKQLREQVRIQREGRQNQTEWGGWLPHKLIHIESGIEFEFKNIKESSEFINEDPLPIFYKLTVAKTHLEAETKIRQNGVYQFIIKPVY